MRADADASRLVGAPVGAGVVARVVARVLARVVARACGNRYPAAAAVAMPGAGGPARVRDKWSVFVIDRLGQGSMRFSELRRGIDGTTTL